MRPFSRNPYIGHPSQLLHLNNYKMVGGFSDGLRATDVRNGKIDITVSADRGMDIPYLSYKGVNVGYIAPCGMVSPQYYDDKGMGFFRGFTAGFLTTCGLTHMGAPSEVDGKSYGMHGRLSNIPADYYQTGLTSDETSLTAVLSGEMSQALLFGEKLTSKRRFEITYDKKSFRFIDEVTNFGFSPVQHMMLYHFNIGYPLLDESAEIIIPEKSVAGREPYSQSDIANRLRVPSPIHEYQEMCYFYRLRHDRAGRSCAAVYNHNLDVGVCIAFDTSVLDHFTQWKMVGEGEYVIGLEPGNATPLGVAKEKELGHLKYLEAGETRTYHFDVSILDGKDDLTALKQEISGFEL